ncbi:MAG: DEAD/DEAH box helicase [Isosphaeraceae bacterium]
MGSTLNDDPLGRFLPAVGNWFRDALGAPTPAQAAAWPSIAGGSHTLIAAPTGSGKTLAGFLACLDDLWRRPGPSTGVGVLYISPLKALNEDVARNLEWPRQGIVRVAEGLGSPLREIRVAVRTGDTPAAERQRLVRKPPDVLITTPESLHLILTSRAREILRGVHHVLVDEIHALCGNKRGVFLSVLLERLEAIRPGGFVRVGMSATQRPLDEVARFLGGRQSRPGAGGRWTFSERPVTVIDAGVRKDLDLQVVAPATLLGPVPEKTVWPSIERQLSGWIGEHRSTIVFANNRRLVERLTARINDRPDDDAAEEPQAQAHHGSISLERRREVEDRLKRGELRAVVATASLELGIDMGAVDLVVQVESPGGVARGLQRIGRAGHGVGLSSKGRLVAKTAGDLLELAAVAKGMMLGQVEALRVPTDCLDILAQQVIACVAVDRWDAPALFDLFRGAYPYRNLPADAFERVLEMISGRFGLDGFRDLKPRVSWDRIHNRLEPLPGTAQLAIVGGGAIPDTGRYPLLLGENGARLGELDEEFVLERRVGETFVLGTATWRIESIDPQRVVVRRAEGQPAFLPFYRGESAGRTAEVGELVGTLCRELADRVDQPGVISWLESEYRLDTAAARQLRGHVARQKRVAGVVPDDRTVLVEAFRDPTGDMGLAVLTPFGNRLHLALKLALQGHLRERMGIDAACIHDDDAILIRLPGVEDPPLDLLGDLTPERAEEWIRRELPDSPLFGLRFRQNAGRALLMPRPDPGKRAPLWLQRLRAKDLLQVVRRVPDFPVVVETLRECLDDDLSLGRLRSFLSAIQDGSIRVVGRSGETPSPFTSEVIFKFTQKYLYEWDEPRRNDGPHPAGLGGDLIDRLQGPEDSARWMDAEAIAAVERRLRGHGLSPRTVAEMAEELRRLGDLDESEILPGMGPLLETLEAEGRAERIELAGVDRPGRWILAEEDALYRSAFDVEADRASIERVVLRYLETHALIGLPELLRRYPIDPATATDLLERWSESGRLVAIPDANGEGTRWADPANRRAVEQWAILQQRRSAVTLPPEAFADFQARWQKAHPATRLRGQEAVGAALESLEGFALAIHSWENAVLPARVEGFRSSWLDDEWADGSWRWREDGDLVAFATRDFGGAWPDSGRDPLDEDSARILEYLDRRDASFATDIAVETGISPSRVRQSLDALARLGLATNDRLDPLRAPENAPAEALAAAQAGRGRRIRLTGSGRGRNAKPEGRWTRIRPRQGGEGSYLSWIEALLGRYPVLCRETAELDPWAPPWRELLPYLDRAELRGEVRRGYFVEGLSGIQFASPEAAESLARYDRDRPADSAPWLLNSIDPANLYGSGAPFDIPLLDGGKARLVRSPGNSLAMIGGRPVLIIEAHGRRLTGLPSASDEELSTAIALISTLAGPSRRVIKVETYNGEPACRCAATPWLAAAGLVREPPAMTYYAGW